MQFSRELSYIYSNYSYITNDTEYLKLKYHPHHIYSNVYDHSIRVACLVMRGGKFLGEENTEKAVRAALLHDFTLNHFTAFKHPKEAAENAKRFCITREEEKAILTHMFPLGPVPTSRIGWAVTVADKIAAFYEVAHGFFLKAKFFRYFSKLQQLNANNYGHN